MSASPKKSPEPPKLEPIELLKKLLADARAAESAGDAKRALALLEGAPEPLRVFGSWHYARGSLLFRKGDLEGAAAAFREAVKREPEIPEFKANLGAALVEAGRKGNKAALEEAIGILEEASLGPRPRTALLHNNLGMALQAAGRLEEALRSFEIALEIDPKAVSALYNKAATLHLLGREEECLEALEETLKVAPQFEPARVSRANTLKRLGRA